MALKMALILSEVEGRTRTRPAESLLAARILEHEIGALGAGHDGGSVDVARRQGREDRGVDDAQPRDAVHPEALVDDGAGRIRAHPARAGGVEDRVAARPDVVDERLVARGGRAGLQL